MPDKGIELAAELMSLAARTAPKSLGQDFVVMKTVTGRDLSLLAAEMVAYGKETGKRGFDRDARGVENSPAVLLIGIGNAASAGLDCGACGFPACDQRTPAEGPEFMGNQCALRILDMGIAIGSAVKMAGLLNVDNRVMYRVGVLARKIGFIEADLVMGIPLSATGKNIYFDRKS